MGCQARPVLCESCFIYSAAFWRTQSCSTHVTPRRGVEGGGAGPQTGVRALCLAWLWLGAPRGSKRGLRSLEVRERGHQGRRSPGGIPDGYRPVQPRDPPTQRPEHFPPWTYQASSPEKGTAGSALGPGGSGCGVGADVGWALQPGRQDHFLPGPICPSAQGHPCPLCILAGHLLLTEPTSSCLPRRSV